MKEESFKSKSPEGGKRDSFLGQRASDSESALYEVVVKDVEFLLWLQLLIAHFDSQNNSLSKQIPVYFSKKTGGQPWWLLHNAANKFEMNPQDNNIFWQHKVN